MLNSHNKLKRMGKGFPNIHISTSLSGKGCVFEKVIDRLAVLSRGVFVLVNPLQRCFFLS
ncbi:hypothetical protein GCM10007216_32510 [Thalassobacillus devorans]|uniref:Uncharacterized protein n=1 Tax=Thalassobacillus devorans TaxID=279813 RepID=A0ABQ1PLD6_9BACI|nr:hypothetical protein GCM10007216_32510 [Thalassobacillus devorans]